MKPPPPMLPAVGQVTAMAKAVAIAASTALPPSFMIATPTSEAIAEELATTPVRLPSGDLVPLGDVAAIIFLAPIFVAGLAVLSPMWGPALMRTVPAFRASVIDVSGARFVPEDAVRALAAIPADASVWDELLEAEARPFGCHPDIGGIEQLQAAGNGIAVHRRHDRFMQIEVPQNAIHARFGDEGTQGVGDVPSQLAS